MDSSAWGHMSHMPPTQVSSQPSVVTELCEPERLSKDRGGREHHRVPFLGEARDPWKIRDSRASAVSWVVCFHNLLCEDCQPYSVQDLPGFKFIPKPLPGQQSWSPAVTARWHSRPARCLCLACIDSRISWPSCIQGLLGTYIGTS